ncbi:hypothetical protein ACM61V_22525 [Sphingomonas sp. TX0543]|uniref:hypothetical protein n=1 Tax=Sphingomonas sp. TX0543 TaxID=3399682 RepID=UPI003AFB17C8
MTWPETRTSGENDPGEPPDHVLNGRSLVQQVLDILDIAVLDLVSMEAQGFAGCNEFERILPFGREAVEIGEFVQFGQSIGGSFPIVMETETRLPAMSGPRDEVDVPVPRAVSSPFARLSIHHPLPLSVAQVRTAISCAYTAIKRRNS